MLVAAVGALSYFSGKRYLASVRAVQQTLAVQSAIDDARSLLKDAETGQRGFLLTGDEQFLEPYAAAQAGTPRRLAELQRLLGTAPAAARDLAALERLFRQKTEFIEASIARRRAGDAEAALVMVRSGRGRQLMDAIRAVCARLRARQEELLNARRHEAEAAEHLAAWGVGIGTVFTVLLALGSLLTVHRDVEILRATAEELAVSEEHFRLLADNSSDLVRVLDLQGKTTYVSPSVERLLGFGVQEFLEQPAMGLMHESELGIAREIMGDLRAGTLTDGLATYRLRHKSGEFRVFEVRWSSIKSPQGEVVGVHTAGRDVTERQRAEQQLAAQAEQLRALSLRDELTGLYNRRGFIEVAGQAKTQAERDGRRAALVFVDLNGMKRINDELGHEAGDAALSDAARVLTRGLGPADVVARLGGDEFTAFALGLGPGDLPALRQRLRELADAETSRNARAFRLSMSVGASFTDPDSNMALEQLLEHADAAMYAQKRARQAAGGVSIPPPAG